MNIQADENSVLPSVVAIFSNSRKIKQTTQSFGVFFFCFVMFNRGLLLVNVFPFWDFLEKIGTAVVLSLTTLSLVT